MVADIIENILLFSYILRPIQLVGLCLINWHLNDLNADDCQNRCGWFKTTLEVTVNMVHVDFWVMEFTEWAVVGGHVGGYELRRSFLKCDYFQ